ncbi:benzoate/H(+) symporter BenE family transporter [Pokkaliibacter sp. CJK22405]|uniref:benzoate/H(+) symporter BenE family transporter n=1 Tax=Pokkaliibacter sp. CJK22405 TaxID=3384615 RepID=UPI0039855DEA
MRQLSLSPIVAGFIAVLVGFSSSAVLIFQAASAAGANAEQTTTWLMALGLGTALTSFGLSWWYKAPVLTAWSTPGAALLVSALSGYSMNVAVGAFIVSSILIVLCGVTGLFERLMKHIPKALSGAMLAGVLFHFGLNVFTQMQDHQLLIGLMLLAYLFGKALLPRYAILLVLVVGCAYAGVNGQMHMEDLTFAFTLPSAVMPDFSLSAIIGVSLPLFIVTMASQNLPGVAVIRANQYDTPISPLITWTGLASLVLAPFGGFALNLAAITAAICSGPEAHPDTKQRYQAPMWAGVFYLITALLASTVVSLFSAFPQALIMALAGIALFSTIGNSLSAALSEPSEREAALVTFLITASGLTLWSVGAAFWGLVGGLLVTLILSIKRQ